MTFDKGVVVDERWARLDEYPTYAVSTHGKIANIKRDTLVQPMVNQQGIMNVALYGKQGRTTKSVALLVAKTFIPQEFDHFNSPINLDGSKTNCQVENLLWRPRGYVRPYLGQFAEPYFHETHIHLRELKTGEEYETLKQASIANGLRYRHIELSYLNRTASPITFQRFERLD